MKILYVAIDQQVPGVKGGSIHVRAVADGLAALGHDVQVAVQPGGGGFPIAISHGPRETGSDRVGADTDAATVRARSRDRAGEAGVGRVSWHAIGAPLGNPHLRLAQVGRVKSLARTVKPDIVIERYHNFGGEGLLAAREVGAPSVLEVNAPVIDYPGSPKRRLDRLLLVEPMRRWRDWQCRAAALIVSPTRAILPAWVPADRVLEVEWGADTDRFRPDAAAARTPDASAAASRTTAPLRPLPFTPDSRLTVVFVGAFRAWHGVHHLVQAMRQLHDRGQRGFRAVLIGDGPELPKARALAVGLEETVTFTGALPHDTVAACLAASDVGVAPFDLSAHAPLSLTFYWSPLKMFEYMASGLPVVAPDIPRLRTIITPGETGVLYDARDPGALAAALETLTDAPTRIRLGAAARARAVDRFSWASHCRLLDAALRPLAAVAGGRRGATG
jgi:glycosyltransferase involved in cell wall biosynthesis